MSHIFDLSEAGVFLKDRDLNLKMTNLKQSQSFQRIAQNSKIENAKCKMQNALLVAVIGAMDFSSDVIRETIFYLKLYELPPCCLISLSWFKTVVPLLKHRLSDRVDNVQCTQRLIVEAGMGAAINVAMMSGGPCVALSSGVRGDGMLRVFPSFRDRARSKALAVPGVGQAVIGFAEVGGAAAHVLGVAVGESVGFGAELCRWSLETEGFLESTVPLEHSDTICGAGADSKSRPAPLNSSRLPEPYTYMRLSKLFHYWQIQKGSPRCSNAVPLTITSEPLRQTHPCPQHHKRKRAERMERPPTHRSPSRHGRRCTARCSS